MNLGTKAERCVIGELAKFDIAVVFHYPNGNNYDLVADIDGEFYKIQVKSCIRRKHDAIPFDLRKGHNTKETYTRNDCDIVALFDHRYNTTYLLGPKDFEGRTQFTIRYWNTLNGQDENCNWHDDFVICRRRIQEVFK